MTATAKRATCTEFIDALTERRPSRETTASGKGHSKSCSRVAITGVPYHSVEKYLARLLEKGLKVALCEDLPE